MPKFYTGLNRNALLEQHIVIYTGSKYHEQFKLILSAKAKEALDELQNPLQLLLRT